MSGLGNLSHTQFVVTLERLSAVSGESLSLPVPPHLHPMSAATNKAAIVNSPNFTAACRNPVLPFSFSSTSTLCWDQSGLSRPQKNLRLWLHRLSAAGLTLPNSLPFRRLHHAICFHLSNSSISITKENAGTTESLEETTLFPHLQRIPPTSCLLGRNKTSRNNLHHLHLL